MSEAVDKYQDALRKLDAAKRKVAEMMQAVAAINQRLSGDSWKTARPSGARPGSLPVDLSRWPSGEELSRALTDYYDCRDAAARVWEALPKDYQIGLRPPADYH